jgi:hypothetical protein
MASVKDDSDVPAIQSSECLAQNIVTQHPELADRVIVAGTENLVESIFLVSIVIRGLRPVTAEIEHHPVTWLRACHQPVLKRVPDEFVRCVCRAQNSDLVVLQSKALAKEFRHFRRVCIAPRQSRNPTISVALDAD